jgi:hypothetical protein
VLWGYKNAATFLKRRLAWRGTTFLELQKSCVWCCNTSGDRDMTPCGGIMIWSDRNSNCKFWLWADIELRSRVSSYGLVVTRSTFPRSQCLTNVMCERGAWKDAFPWTTTSSVQSPATYRPGHGGSKHFRNVGELRTTRRNGQLFWYSQPWEPEISRMLAYIMH